MGRGTADVWQLVAGSAQTDELISLAGSAVLARLADPVHKALRATDFKRPFNQGAGSSQIASRIEPNTFAADLAPVLRRYFSSREQTADEEIYSRAYISSNEVTSYDRILESFLKDRIAKTGRRTAINTTRKKAEEITKTLSDFGKRSVAGDIQLVTGSVGAGKSLFARRYKEFLQPDQLKQKNRWAFLNFNNAPEDHARWSDWVSAYTPTIQALVPLT